jgi:hypothetical protein
MQKKKSEFLKKVADVVDRMAEVDKRAVNKPPMHLISPGKLMFFWRLPNNSLTPCLNKPKVIAAQNRFGVGVEAGLPPLASRVFPFQYRPELLH